MSVSHLPIVSHFHRLALKMSSIATILISRSICVMIFLFLTSTVVAQFIVTNVYPNRHAKGISTGSGLVFTFSGSPDPATVNSSTIIIRGSHSGVLSALYTVDGIFVRVDPVQDFYEGETVYIYISTGIENGGVPLAGPWLSQFTVASSPGFPVFGTTGEPATSNMQDVQRVIPADINGDGHIDLVSGGDNKVAWFESNGAVPPVYTEHVVSTAGIAISDVSVGDIDNNGDLDIIGADSGSNSITWFRNNGGSNPSFDAFVISTTVSGVTSVTTGDMDADGDLDVLTASPDDNTVAWFEHDGNLSSPSFTKRIISMAPDGFGPNKIKTGDIDNDGHRDVVVAFDISNRVNWYKNSGTTNPTFTQYTVGSSINQPVDVEVGDLDGDGDLDVVTASLSGEWTRWYVNNWPSSFTWQLVSTGGSLITDIALADIDGDCHLDILRTSSGDDMVAFFRNNGLPNPAFSDYVISTTAAGVTSVTAADLTGDGIMNIITSAADSDEVLWFNTQPVPQLTSTTPVHGAIDVSGSANIVLQFDISMLASSINSDNIVVTGSYSGLIAGTFSGGGTSTITFNPTVDFFPGEILTVASTDRVQSLDSLPAESEYFNFTVATGPLSYPDQLDDREITGGALHTTNITICDLNDDGNLDILANSIPFNVDEFWFQNNGAANPIFTPINLDDLDLEFYDVGDIDADGYLDIVGVGLEILGDAGDLKWIENNLTDPPFISHIIESEVGSTKGLMLGDMDQDGDLDIVLLREYALTWYENDGGSSPQFVKHVISTWVGTSIFKKLHLADLNNDGDLDIITTDGWDIYYWENDCGNFDWTFAGATCCIYDGITDADMDGDGDSDILAFRNTDGALYWFKNNGGQEPTFDLVVIDIYSAGMTDIVPLDYDADGDMDIICTRGASNRITLYRNNGNPDPGFIPVDLVTGIIDPIALAVGDMDGDGDVDIVCISDTDLNEVHWLELHPQFLLTSTNPAANEIQVSPNTNITLNFNFEVESGSVSVDNIKVYGSQSGLMSGTFTGGGTNVITFTPASSFAYGEQVSVTYTDALLYEEFHLSNPGVLSFTVSSNPVIPMATVYSSHWISTSSGHVRDVACADLDGDGDVDITRVSTSGANLVWHQNNGSTDPSFSALAIGNTASDARSVATADINLDGHVDIVVASAANNMVAWYKNSGAAIPAFSEHIISTTASGVTVVSIGDMDHDGDLDIIAGATTQDVIYWYANSGGVSPEFSEQTASSFSNNVSDIVIADVNGDGKLDILAAEDVAGAYVWYQNNGEAIPSFTRNVIAQFPIGTIAICVGDLDSDGDLDVIGGTTNATSKIVWFENDGAISPSFSQHSILSGTYGGLSLTTGDIDADDDLDIVVTLEATDNLKVLVNDGNAMPGFSEINITQTADGVRSVALGDLDGDGDYEFITCSSNDQRVAWYNTQNTLNLFDHYPGNLQVHTPRDTNVELLMDALVDSATLTAQNIVLHGSQSGWIQATINGSTERIIFNPSQDLFPGERVTASVTAGLTKEGYPLANPKVFEFDVDAGSHLNPLFHKNIINEPVSSPTEVILADVNSDGHLDAIEASATSDTISWHENNSAYNPLFTRNIIPSTADSITSISAADIDMDGDVDILVCSYLDDRITWFENSGDSIPTFTESIISSTMDGITALATGDLDRDGDIDIAAVSYIGGEVAWFENDGSPEPVFTKHVLSTTSQGANAIQLYDWDNDGDLDIIRSTTISGNISLFENDGAADPVFNSLILWATNPGDFHVVDIDGNNLPDIFASYPTGNLILMRYNHPVLGPIISVVNTNVGGVSDITAADFNGDGHLDILAAAPAQNRVANFINNGSSPPSFSSSSIVTGVTGVTKLAIGDMDGDGDADLASTLTPVDQVTWYEMDYQRETKVSLINGMLLVEDINGGNSTDNITLSQDGSSLIVQSPGNVIHAIGASCSLVDDFTASMPIDSVSGCRVELRNGIDVLNMNITLTVADSGFIVHGAHFINQNVTTLTTLSGDIILDAIGFPGGVDLYGSLVASDSADIAINAGAIVSLRGFISSTHGDINISSAANNVNILAEGNGIISNCGNLNIESGTDIVISNHIASTDSTIVSLISHRDIKLIEDVLLQIQSGELHLQSDRSTSIYGTVSSVSGDIVIHANQQTIPTSGAFNAIDILDSAIVMTESGVIEMSGRGGDAIEGSHFYNYGIQIRGEVISAGASPNAGSIALHGEGGPYYFLPGNGVFLHQGHLSIRDGELNILGVSGPRLIDPSPPIPPGHIVNYQGTILGLGSASIHAMTE